VESSETKSLSSFMSFGWLLSSLLLWVSFVQLSMSAVYFPTLSHKFTFNKRWTAGNNSLTQYQVDGQNIFEVYDHGVFNHIYLSEQKTYQNTYFDSSDPNSTFYNLTLADYDFDGHSLYFLLADQQIRVVSP
jgi:hypothetical protein